MRAKLVQSIRLKSWSDGMLSGIRDSAGYFKLDKRLDAGPVASKSKSCGSLKHQRRRSGRPIILVLGRVVLVGLR